MTEEEIKYYKALKNKFDEIAPWQQGDLYLCNDKCPKIHMYGECQPFEFYNTLSYDPIIPPKTGFFRIPHPIDLKDSDRKKLGEKPRGLWGMINWVEWWHHHSEDTMLKWLIDAAFKGIPTLQLLKIIAEQEGITVE